MELDQLKTAWVAQQERLDNSLQLNATLLAQLNLGRARRSLTGISAELGFEIAGLAAIMLFTGSFAVDHTREPRFWVPAVALWAYALGVLISVVRQLVETRGVDFDEPVVAIQLRLERLRLRRAKIVGWLLAFGPLFWLPGAIVALRGLFGIDVYANVSANWIAANAALGLAVIPLCVWIARTFGGRLGAAPMTRSVVDAIAGNCIAEALQSVEATRRFEQGL